MYMVAASLVALAAAQDTSLRRNVHHRHHGNHTHVKASHSHHSPKKSDKYNLLHFQQIYLKCKMFDCN